VDQEIEEILFERRDPLMNNLGMINKLFRQKQKFLLEPESLPGDPMRIFALIVLSFVLVSCSSAKKEKASVEQKVAVSKVDSPQGLSKTIEDHIESSTSLTEEQKTALRMILGENKRRAEELTTESFKNRGVLIQELLSGKYTPQRVTILQKEIERIEKLRLKNTFDTVKKISKIISGQPDLNQFADEMLHMENRGATRR
jgi:uncharacterized small protein (DUF1192 family)